MDAVLSAPDFSGVIECYSHHAAAAQVRATLDELRSRLLAGSEVDEGELMVDSIARRVEDRLSELSRPGLQRVVNATGVVVHTNLGRASLADAAIEAVKLAAAEPCALEYDLGRGTRGDRDRLVEEHLLALTGAEAATVVNNNAAAVLLALNTLAEGREVVVSRGELIEIGGSFRIPELAARSGARLREVGTTNRTHPADYENALGPETAVLLKVHTSNYRIVGFTAEVGLDKLVEIACGHSGIVVVEDLGAGALVDLSRWGLPREPVVAERVAAGAGLVTFSGDKLLGGPQCGVVVGRRELVERLRRNPLKRALRVDKLTMAALEATLRLYRFDPAPEHTIPVLAALIRPLSELETLGCRAISLLENALDDGFCFELQPTEARAGSGAQPQTAIESMAVAVGSADRSPDAVAALFRSACPPIIGRIEKDRFLLDLRTVTEAQELVPRLR